MSSLILVNVFAAAFPYTLSEDVCLEIKRVENFQLDKYVEGTWYEIGRAAEKWYEDGDCTFVTHEKQANGTILHKTTIIIHNRPFFISGFINPPKDTRGDGLIEYIDFNSEPKQKRILTVDVVAIDYNRYVIFYRCYYEEAIRKLRSYFWIMGRTITLDDSSRDEIYKLAEDNNLFKRQDLTLNNYTTDSCKIV